MYCVNEYVNNKIVLTQKEESKIIYFDEILKYFDKYNIFLDSHIITKNISLKVKVLKDYGRSLYKVRLYSMKYNIITKYKEDVERFNKWFGNSLNHFPYMFNLFVYCDKPLEETTIRKLHIYKIIDGIIYCEIDYKFKE